MPTQQQIIEHIVLFNVKPGVDLDKAAAMIDGLNSLASLDLAIYLSAGEILLRSGPTNSLTFTHILHSRFKSNDDLHAFDNHPEHARVVTEFVQPIIDDIMFVDWKSNITISDYSPKPGSAMRVTLLKLKEDLAGNKINKYFKVLRGIKNRFEAIEEISFGESLSGAMAKGYSICSIVVFPGSVELEAFDSDAELQKLLEKKVKNLAENELVVDYVISVPLLKKVICNE